MGPPKKDPRTRHEHPGEPPVEQDRQYDDAVADSFPASDPPGSSGIIGPGRRPAQPSEES